MIPKCLEILRHKVKTATNLFNFADALGVDLLEKKLTARDANVLLSGQRLKLSTVQTSYRVVKDLATVGEMPIFNFSQTKALFEQSKDLRKKQITTPSK